jgi:hypothetical protein
MTYVQPIITSISRCSRMKQRRGSHYPWGHQASLGRLKFSLLSTLLMGLVSGLCVQAQAQEAQPQQDQSNRDKKILQPLDLFLTSPEYRDRDEGVKWSADGRAELWFLESLEYGELDRKVCEGVRWLISGRLARSKGVIAAFNDVPMLKEVTLIFYRIQTKVDPGLYGKYEQSRVPISVARFSISRENAKQLNADVVNQQLDGPGCIERARLFLTDLWISDTIQVRRGIREALAEKKRESRAQPTPNIKEPNPALPSP